MECLRGLITSDAKENEDSGLYARKSTPWRRCTYSWLPAATRGLSLPKADTPAIQPKRPQSRPWTNNPKLCFPREPEKTREIAQAPTLQPLNVVSAKRITHNGEESYVEATVLSPSGHFCQATFIADHGY